MAIDLFDEFRILVHRLHGAGVDYATVGALALAVHGVPRATTDIDFLIEPASVDAALAVARHSGFTVEALPIRFSDGTRLRRVSKFQGEEFITLDFLLVDENLQPAWDSRVEMMTQHGPVRVVSRDALVRMKVAAGRDRDMVDVARLQELDG